MSSSGMMPPPNTTMSVALRRFNSWTTAGNKVMCAPEWMESPITWASSWSAASTTISGVCRRPV